MPLQVCPIITFHMYFFIPFLVLADLLRQGQPTVSCKGQMVNVLGFVSHPVPVANMQLHCCSTKAVTDNMQNMEMAAFQLNLLAKIGGGPDLAMDQVPHPSVTAMLKVEGTKRRQSHHSLEQSCCQPELLPWTITGGKISSLNH